jgi:PAS domain S-box-containing protein
MSTHEKFDEQNGNESEFLYQRNEAAAATALQRRKAEESLEKSAEFSTEEFQTLAPEATRRLLHELRVHQIELEMQNEQLRQSEVELNAARERYFNLYDLAPVSYCVINQRGAICQANLTAASLFGMPRSVLLKQFFNRRIFRDDQDVYYLHQKRINANGDAQSFELRMVKDDGTQFWASVAMTLARDVEGQPELRVMLTDITERIQADAERALLQKALQEKNAELEFAKVAAEKANQVKTDFLTSMSHELRTPLHAILGFGQLMGLGTQALTVEQRQNVDQILGAGWHLLELINEVLDLAIIESGKVEFSMDSVSVPNLINECEQMVEPMAQQRGISIVLQDVDVACYVRADRIRCKQVLINLLSNAIKYNRPDGTVTVDCVGLGAERIRIRVEDTGAGLASDKLSQLFQPFSRLGQEAGVEEGAGIGLALCKRLVEQMGGAIGVDSTVGKGSVFWIELNRGEGTNIPPVAQLVVPSK